CCLTIFVSSLYAQRVGELLYFSSMPQATQYNPANHGNNGFYLSFPSKFHASFNTSGFSYHDLIHQHPQYSDSLQLDFEGFAKKLKDNNYFDIDFNTSLLGFGFSVNKVNHFSFDLSLTVESRLNFTEHLFTLLTDGTNSHEKEFSIFGDKFASATSYLAASFGYARDINEKLTIGGSFKLYFGLLNIKSERTDINVEFDGETMSTISNIEINTANAFANWSMKSALDADEDGLYFDDVTNVGGNIFKNKGMGIDLGATYKINDEMTVSASVLDLGYITWKSNTVNIHSKHPNTRVEFAGAQTQYDNMGNDLEAYFEDLRDSLQYAFDLTTSDNGSYTTMLPTKFYIGYSYNFLPGMYLQALYKGRAIAGKLENSLTVAYSLRLSNLFNVSVANTFASKFFNPQILFTFNDKFYFGASLASSFDVAKMSGFNLYFGANILLFKNKKQTGKCSL
ncbi:MAG: DUF5723 family protein, partial [Bacteroidota bacterium]|nr:DUF5723 family protein [Bacteroidota bacterium]